MTTAHWSSPRICGDLLAEAARPDAAEPVAIHVRSALHALICRQSGSTGAVLSAAGPAGPTEIRLVVDDELPAAPGYEVHRAIPHSRAAFPDPLPTEWYTPVDRSG
jgi:hypothetical protein